MNIQMFIKRQSKIIISLVLALSLAAIPSSCGKRAANENGDSKSVDFVAREAITDALERDRALDQNARNTIQLVKDGQYTLEQGLDDFVDQTTNLLSVIADVAATQKAENPDLAKAQELTENYLRNRVHQIEALLAAKSGHELEASYDSGTPELENQRNRIKDLLLKYDPGLKEFLE